MFNNPSSLAKGFVLGKKLLAVFLSFSLVFSFLTIPSQEALAEASEDMRGTCEGVESLPTSGSLNSEWLHLQDPLTGYCMVVKKAYIYSGSGTAAWIEIHSNGNATVTFPSDNMSELVGDISLCGKEKIGGQGGHWYGIEGRKIIFVDSIGNILATGTTGEDGKCVMDSGTSTEPVPQTRKVRVSSFSGNGTLKINGANVSAAEEVSISSEEAMTVSWQASAGTTSADNVSLMTSLSIDGQSVDVSNIDKTKWQVTNTAYQNKMNETGVKMTTLDAVKAAEQTVTIPASTVASLATTSSSEVSIEVQFSEYVPVYRLYNQITSEHLFTTNKTEYDTFVQKCESGEDVWIGEGIDWFAEVTPETANDNTVRRFYNAALGAMGSSSHYYSKDATEIAALLQNGWVDDGAANYIQSRGTAPIWTCYNEGLGSAHHYTSNKTEWEGLSVHGWALETDKNLDTGVFQAVMSAKP